MPLGPIDEPISIVDQVTDRLRQSILDGGLAPGAHLSVPRLAALLGVSRTPVREALVALEGAGLVVQRLRRGAVVFGGGPDDLRALFELREALDGMAARLAADRIDDGQRAELGAILCRHERALDEGAVDDHVRYDLAFHAYLRSCCGNDRIIRELARLHDQTLLVMRSTASTPGAMGAKVRRDHRAVFDAVVGGDPDAAERAARDHVRNIARFVERSRAAASATEPDPELVIASGSRTG